MFPQKATSFLMGIALHLYTNLETANIFFTEQSLLKSRIHLSFLLLLIIT